MEREQSPEDRQQAAFEALERAREADPRQSPFGFYGADDFAGGAGMFHWYQTLSALLEALSHDLAFAFFDDDPDEAPAVAGQLSTALLGVHDVRDLDEARLNQLRECLTGVQQLPWVGTFAQLCGSEGEWVSEVRCSFRECNDDQADEGKEGKADLDRPIAAAEVDGFIEFVAEYGV